MEHPEKVILFENTLFIQSFIKKFDLAKKEIELYENGIGNNYKISFYNSKRCISVTLCIAFEHIKLGDSISVIINKEDQVDIDDEPYFLLTEWAEHSKDKNDWKRFYINAYEGTFEKRLESFFVYLNELFEDEELSKVLRGETWMIFGFDWRGMK